MSARQVQKLSRGSGPRRSVRPAMARWKAWQCRLVGAGSRMAWRSPSAGAPGVTAAMRPSGGDLDAHASCQPVGVRAVSAQRSVMSGPRS